MKKSVIGIFLLALVIGGCSKTPEDKITDLYEKGQEQLAKGEFDEAFESFSEIKDIDAASVLWQMGQAQVFEKRFQFYDAINAYLGVTYFHPSQTEAYLKAAELFSRMGYYNDAVWTLQNYRKVEPNNNSALISEVKIQLKLEDLKFADQALDRIANSYHDADVPKIYSAVSSYLKGDINKANMTLSEIESDSQEAFEALADYYELRYILDSSVYFSQKALEASGNDYETKVKHLFRLLQYNYLADSRKIISEIKNQFPDSALALGLDYFYSKFRGSKAQIQLDGTNYFARVPFCLSGKLYQLEGEEAINNLITIDQERKIFNSGYYDEITVPSFKQFLQFKFFFSFHHAEIINSNLVQFETLGQQRLSTREVQLDYAKSKYVTGEFEEGLRLLTEAEKLHLNDPVWLTELGDIYAFIKKEFLNDATRLYEKALTINPTYVKAFDGLVKANLIYLKYNEAEKLFKKYPYFKTNPTMLLRLAYVNILNNNYQAGLKNFETGFKSLSGPTADAVKMIELLKKKFKFVEGEKIVDLMSGFSPDNPDVLIIAADFYSNHNQAQKGLELAEKALSLDPDNQDALVQKAVAHFHLGNKVEAFEILEANKTKFPRNKFTQYYLARFLALDRVDDLRAQNIGRESIFNSYGDPYFVINLSDIYYMTGRPDLAFGEARKACRADRFSPYAFYRMAMAASLLGRDEIKEEAKDALKRANELGLPAQYDDSVRVARERLK